MAGFERLDGGEVRLGSEVVDDGRHVFVPSEHRRIGYVPQEGALFPHLSVGPQRRLRASPRAEPPGARARAPGHGRALGSASALPPSALGRPAAAGGAGAGAGHRPRVRPPRRALLVPRRQPAGQRAGRGARRAAPGRHDVDPGDPRPGRGAVHGRPGRGAAPRRHRPARHAGRHLPAVRSTPRWPGSWGSPTCCTPPWQRPVSRRALGGRGGGHRPRSPCRVEGWPGRGDAERPGPRA